MTIRSIARTGPDLMEHRRAEKLANLVSWPTVASTRRRGRASSRERRIRGIRRAPGSHHRTRWGSLRDYDK